MSAVPTIGVAVSARELRREYGAGPQPVVALPGVDLGQTVVMATYDPGAAAHADRVIFMADGRLVDELRTPTAGQVLDTLARLEPAPAAGR